MSKLYVFLFLFLLSVQMSIAQTVRYECWVDNDYDNRTVVSNSQTELSFDIDIGSLIPGLHYFSFRAQDNSGEWGGLSRYMFFVKQDITDLTGIEYWIDDDKKSVGIEQVSDGNVIITVDLTSLQEGEHEFYIHGFSQNGYTFPLEKYAFVLSEEPVVVTPEITRNGNVITIETTTEGVTIYYTLDGIVPTVESSVYTGPITLTQNCTVRAIAVKEGMENSEEATLEVSGLTTIAAVPAPHIAQEGNVVTITVPSVGDSFADVTASVAVEPSSWGGSAPKANLSGDWTCTVLDGSGNESDTYAVTLNADGKALFPGQAYVNGSWSYNNGTLTLNHYKLSSGDNYNYDDYSLTPTNSETPIEFTGTRRTTYGNAWVENHSNANVRLTYNGTSIGVKKITTEDGRETTASIVDEGGSEKTGTLLQQTISGLADGYYTVELYAKSSFSSAQSMATDVTYLFANNVQLFIPVEADKEIREHNVYQIGVEVTDGTLRLGLEKMRNGANWHAIQIKSMKRNTLSVALPMEDATIFYTLDGTVPSTENTLYTEPVALAQNCTVRAMALMNGMAKSEEGTLEVGGLTKALILPAPVIIHEDNMATITVTSISTSATDLTAKVAVEPSSWGGVAPKVDLSGEWTCTVLDSSGNPTDTYAVTLSSDGKAFFPEQAYVDGSWSYNSSNLSLSHYRLLSGDNYQYDNYSLTTTTPDNPVEFTGTRMRTVGNAWTENNSQTNVRLTYNGTSIGVKKVTTEDGRETTIVIADEGGSEKTGTLLQQTINGLENGYYTVELYAKSCYSSAQPMATDVTYLFANSTKLFIPLEADKELREHNIYQLQVEVSDGTLHLGLGKEKTGANWHALQIKALKHQSLSTTETMEDAVVHYTLDGTMPTETSPIYSEPILLTKNGILNAFAVRDGFQNSGYASLEIDWFKVADVMITPIGKMVEMSSSTEGAVIHYTTDGSAPTATSAIYSEPLSFDHDVIIKAIGIKDGFNDSEVTTYEYKVGAVTVATPSFVCEGNTLTITTVTEDATIYYTMDGDVPTVESIRYDEPITLTQNCTVRAIAVKEGFNNSEIAIYEVGWFKTENVAFSVSNLRLTMTTATEGATIRYTTDGTAPTAEGGTVYTAPVEMAALADGCIVKAVATKEYFDPSEVTTFEYHRAEYTTAMPAIAFNAADSTVTMSCATEGAIIRYTLDGTDPTEASPTYTDKVKPERNCTVKAFATADEHFASGISERIINSFKVQPVTFSLNGLSLTLSTDTKDATIYYSTDGSEPQTAYSGVPITLGDAALTVKAYASRDGWIDSDITSYGYDPDKHTVEPPVFIRNGNELTITTVVDGAAIYYTMDGSTPTEASNRYNTPITLTQNCTVKAFATAEGMLPSSVVSYDVTDFKAGDVTFSVNSLLLTMETATDDAVIRYTTDGTPPTEDTGLTYSEPLSLATLTDGSTVYAIATKENFNPSDVTWFVYHRYDYMVATPTFEVFGNELTISTSTAGASIYYTTDGTDPTTESTLYTVPILLNGNMTVKAIATAEGLFDSEIASHIVGGFQVDTPIMALDYATGTLTITCNTAGSSIYYIIGNGASQEYSGPVTLTDNSSVRAWATAEGYNDSGETSIKPIANGTMDGETFRINGAVTANELLFLRNIMGGQMEHLDMENATLTDSGLGDEAFAGMGILTVRLPKSMTTVGERLFSGCRRLAAVVWRAGTGPAPAVFEGIGNPNLLLYVDSEEAGRSTGVANLIVNQMAAEITLSDPVVSAVSEVPVVPAVPEISAVSDYNFYCPIPFTANKISYCHVYTQQSGIGGTCQGWETIALPFDVQTITHRIKGAIAPFGSPLLGGGAGGGGVPFWLYELGSTRFEVATTIEANKPYVISMPQNPGFAAQYCLGGDTITFSATNAYIPVTAPQTATRYTKSLHANFTTQAASASIWAMNIGEPQESYAEGSVFVQGLRAVRPFEAYGTTTSGVRYITLFDDEANGIDDLPIDDLRFDSNDVYDLGGRRTTEGGRRILPHKRLVIKNGKVKTAK